MAIAVLVALQVLLAAQGIALPDAEAPADAAISPDDCEKLMRGWIDEPTILGCAMDPIEEVQPSATAQQQFGSVRSA